MPALSASTSARIAVREMRSSRGKFFLVVLSIAIGVAALTGVRGFSNSFRATLLLRARAIMAADLSARTAVQPTPAETAGLQQIEARGVRMTTVTELLSMASSPRTMDPLLVSLKAVDPADYPFYGTVELAPAASLASVLTPDSVVVADDLLIRLKLKVGDSLKLGDRLFRIASIVVNEPDRLSSSFSPGPRVLISRQGLESSGLLAPGSHAGQRYLFMLPRPSDGRPISDDAVAALKARLLQLLPEAQITDYRETNPALTAGLDQATSLLSLMSLVALVLGAVGVAMAMRSHLQQRLDTIAIMKSLGAQSMQIIQIYLVQTLFLGLIGGALGALLGCGVQLVFPWLLGSLINIQPDLHVDGRAVATGLAAGICTTLLFTLPPLLDIRGIRPILILRRSVEDFDQSLWTLSVQTLRGSSDARLQWMRRVKGSLAQLVTFLLILAGLAVIASRVSDSPSVGRWFSAGLVAVLLVLLLACFLLLRGLRMLLARTRMHLPSVARHALANLYRPGNPSAPLLAALGLGVMQIMLIFLMQQAVIRQLQLSAAPNLPNLFLIDIANDEVDGLRHLLTSSPIVTVPPELLPVVSSRILAINGTPAAQLKLQNFPKRMLQSIQLTWSAALPPGDTLTAGKWWTVAQSSDSAPHPVVAIAQHQADRLGVRVGSSVEFAAQDRRITATVVALLRADGQHAYSRAEFILPQPALSGLPVVWYGGVHAVPARVSELQRSLYAAYPTVTVINVAQALESIRSVVIQIIYVVEFLAAFSIFAGIIILASSIAGTRYRRIREVVVLKTLGAARSRIAVIFSIEFAVLGLVAGAVGIFFANIVVRGLLRALNIPPHVAWGWSLGGLAVTASLTVAAGWLASHRILGQKPLEVLREE